MISIAVTDLVEILLLRRMALDEIFICPADVSESVVELFALHIGVLIFINRPSENGCRIGHREIELNIISCVEPSSGQIKPRVRTIFQAGVTAPVRSGVLREFSRALQFIEKKGLLKSLAVVILSGPLRSFVAVALDGADRLDLNGRIRSRRFLRAFSF